MKPANRSSFFLLLLITLLVMLPACTSPFKAPANPPRADPTASAPLPASTLDIVDAALTDPAPSRTLDDYKQELARHVMQRNREYIFEGDLPPLLPAVVVVNITVDRTGQLHDAQVQRSRDQGASEVALASLRRSGPLPRPDGLGPPHGDLITFSETFLFGERYRFQLRTLASPQLSGL